MADIFELVGKIAIKNDDAKKNIDDTIDKAKELARELEGTGDGADDLSGKLGKGSKFGTSAIFLGNMLATTATAAAKFVKKFGADGIKMASDLEQSMGGVETLFGDATEMVFANADKAYKTAGMTANKYMQTVTTFAAALKQSVETEAEAAEVADMAIIDMSDNANKMGTDMKSIQNAYQGFAKQNYTMLDNLKLGYFGTKNEMKRLLADAEKLSGQKFDMDNLADVFKAIHVIQEDLGIAGTTAEEAATTWAGSSASAKSAWENLLASTVSDVLPKMTEALNKIMSFAEQNPETIEKFADAFSKFASISIGAVTGFLQFLLDNGKEVATVLAVVAVGFAASAVAAHPFAAAIMAVVSGLAYLKSKSDEFAEHATFNHFFDQFSDEDMGKLQRWIDAEKEVEKAYEDLAYGRTDQASADAAADRAAAAYKEASAVDDLIATYQNWKNNQATDEKWLDVPARISEDSQSAMQGELDAMTLEAMAKIYPDMSQVLEAQNTALTFYADIVPRNTPAGVTGVDGSHAGGLDRVPFDGYIARLHKDEKVLTSTQAAAYDAGQMGAGTGRVEAMLAQTMMILQQIVSNTASGQQVVLDSGALVGQIAPQMDAQLGAISQRKGRRN